MLRTKNLSLELNKSKILDGVNIYIEKATITTIIGKNGSGKSSLVNCINGTLKYSGDIFIGNNNTDKNEINIKDLSNKEKAKYISILPQILLYPHIKVIDLIKMGRNPYLRIGQKLSNEDLDIVNKAINDIGIVEFIDKYVDELSGGERQKVYLTMMLSQNADILILDEPTTYMDLNNEIEFLNLLNKLKIMSNKTIVIIMHNLMHALNYSDNIIIMNKGEVCTSGKVEELIRNKNIEEIFNVKVGKYENKYIVI